MFLQQSVTNTVAHGGSSAEFAKWRDADEDPELLCHAFDASEVKPGLETVTDDVGPAWSEVVPGKVSPSYEVVGYLATKGAGD